MEQQDARHVFVDVSRRTFHNGPRRKYPALLLICRSASLSTARTRARLQSVIARMRITPGLLVAFVLQVVPTSADDRVSFRSDVAPILLNRCLACHGSEKAEGGYRVDTYARAMSEGDSFTPGFVPDDLEFSEAFRRITSDDPAERMPLEGEKLPQEEVAKIRRWIEQGAEFDGGNPAAPLAAIIPPPQHPEPPSAYAHPLPITAIQFDKSGERLFVSGYYEVTVWSTSTGELLQRIKNAPQRIYAIALRPDGEQLAVAGGAPGRTGEVRLFDAESGELQQVLHSTSDVVLDVAYDPPGRRLTTAGADNIVRIFDAETFKEQQQLTSHSDWVMDVAWDDKGERLASGSRDKTVKAFNVESGEMLVTYSGHEQTVNGVAFHPNGNQIYSSGSDEQLHRWSMDDGKKEAETALKGELSKLELIDGHLFVASAAGKVHQLDAAKHADVRAYVAGAELLLATTFSKETQQLAAGSFSGQVHLWDVEDGSLVRSFIAAPGYNLGFDD